MKTVKKIFWGLLLLATAVLLIAGNFWELPVLDILVLLILAIVFMEGIIHRNFALILFPIAIAVILNSDRFGIGEINPWSVMAAALLGSVGFSVLFPRRGSSYFKNMNFDKSRFNFICNDKGFKEVVRDESGEMSQNESEAAVQDGPEGDSIYLENSFGSTVKYVTSMALSKVRLENDFGNMTVYFNSAVLKDHTAYARVESSFGNMVLYIPASWNVKLHGQTAFGSIKEKGQCDPESRDVLEIKAVADFGNIQIRYI